MTKFTLYTVFLSLIFTSGRSQTFELTENKGQWPAQVIFKGELSYGAFFLGKNGYRVLQHHPSDFAKAIEEISGHPAEGQEDKTVKKLQAAETENLANGGAGKPVKDPTPTVRSHAYDVIFEGGGTQTQIIPGNQMAGYANYFKGNDPSKWASNVKTYGVVTYQNMYPGIDVRYYSENGYLKYDIIVQPNANLQNIKLNYEGVENLSIKQGELYIRTSVNEVKEREPYSYQLVNGVRKTVDCKYTLSGNRVGFKISDYDPASPLVIDPTLVFSTFAGSTTDNWGYTATYDLLGNAYGGGIGFGNGFPTTTGAFQTTFNGGGSTGEGAGFDIVLMKLNPSGTQRIFSTYLGGSGNEQPHSLVVDASGDLVVSGRTTSTNFPTSTNGSIGPGGGWDIVVVKFNPSGTNLIGSVKIGGAGDDGVNIKHKATAPTGPRSLFQNYGDDARSEVIADNQGNIYVASCTRSTDFPVTNAAFQTALSGEQDGLLMRFNSTMALQFATFLGGSGDDAAYVLALEGDGNILVAGGTSSNNFPGNKTGTVGATYGGSLADGFIARMNSSGSSLINSVYIGTNGVDQIYGIQKDRLGFIYVGGTSTGSFGVRNAAYSQSGGKQFIAKLQADFSAYVYSTVFGPSTPNPNISPIAFLVDRCENVYMSGWGGQLGSSTTAYPNSGTTGLPVTPDAIDNTTDGKDFYFFVLERNAASQLYGTFFGQQDPPLSGTPDHVDGGTSRFDPNGVVYQGICANCSQGQFPTTPGVIAPTKPSTATCNLAVVKINFDLSGVVGGIKSSIEGVDGDTSACSPATVAFRDTIGIAQSYEWSFGDGSAPVTTTVPNITHDYNVAGTFIARLIAIDQSRCFPRDTSYVTIRVRPDRATVQADAVKLDPCQDLQYRFDNQSTTIPTKPFKNTSFTWNFGDGTPPVIAGLNSITHKFPASGTYNVRLVLTDTNYCNAPDSITITLRVSPEVNANFDTNPEGCSPYNATFNNTSAGGQSFFWDFGNGTTSTDINPVVFYAVPGVYSVKLIATDPNTCNVVDSITKTINVRAKPVARFTFSPNPAQENIITTFTNLSDPATRYKWDFGDGDTLITIRVDTTVRHQFPQSDKYTVCLVTFSNIGCSDTLCQDIDALVNPLVDVVNAFTPNDDGVNDRAVVLGFGVTKLTFRIFNRWGKMVFETSDPSIGWDGKYNGKPQPMDAYGYTIDAEIIGGEKIKKSGSITLIR